MTTMKSHVRFRKIIARTGGMSYFPDQLAVIYGFPHFTGAGQTVAVIELGGGYVQADLDGYFASRGLSVKPVKFVSIDGATNAPSAADSADAEVMLDLCVIGGVAPGVQLNCYMAPNTTQGFIDAINQAVADKVNAISISWGAPEDQWSTTDRAGMETALAAAQAAGIPVFAAAGDSGSSDGESGNNVDYPASSAYVVGCGGTSLTTTGAVLTETVWNNGPGSATGGGLSSVAPLPSYQVNAGVPGGKFRAVPDVASVADPETGISVVVDGQTYVIGGTSAAAPFWAGLYAVLSQGLGKPFDMHGLVYGTQGGMRDIVSGNNGTYTARAGFDCCSGMGVPIGTGLLALLQGTAPPPSPTPAPPPVPSPPTPPPPSKPVPPPPPAPVFVSLGTLVVAAGGELPAGVYTLGLQPQTVAAVSEPRDLLQSVLLLLGYR